MGLFRDNKGSSAKSDAYAYRYQDSYNDISDDNKVEKDDSHERTETTMAYGSTNNVGSDIDDMINGLDENERMYEANDETAVITAGLTVTGNLDSTGSIDIFGTVEGNVTCMGKLTVSGVVTGSVNVNEIYANDAQIEGDIVAEGSVKIGKGTVIIGNIRGTSAVIAGAIKGNVDIEGPVIIDSTAIVVGDIQSKSVQINNGATIEGRCSQCYADVNTDAVFDIHKKKEEKEEDPDDILVDTLEEEIADLGEGMKESQASDLEELAKKLSTEV